MRIPLDPYERAFTILGLTFFAGGLGGLISVDPPGLIPSSALNTLLRYFIWFGSCVLLIYHWRKIVPILLHDLALWVVVGLALISYAWSDYPDAVYLNSRELLQMMCFGVYFAGRYTWKEKVTLIAQTLVLGGINSFLMVMAKPAIGITQSGEYAGAWKGMYIDKNYMGSQMALGLITLFLVPTETKRGRRLVLGSMLFVAFMIFQSSSKTSLMIAIVLMGMMTLYRNFRWTGKITVVILNLFILIFGSVGTVLISQWEPLLLGMGRDPTLTGRTPIWTVSLSHLWERPLFGFGRGAFWMPGSQYAAEAGAAVTAVGFIPPHAHNGFIDIALDIGVVGFTFFICSLLLAYGRALYQGYATNYSENLWPLAFLTQLIINNMTESLLLYRTTLYWVLFTTIALSAKRDRRDRLTGSS